MNLHSSARQSVDNVIHDISKFVLGNFKKRSVKLKAILYIILGFCRKFEVKLIGSEIARNH